MNNEISENSTEKKEKKLQKRNLDFKVIKVFAVPIVTSVIFLSIVILFIAPGFQLNGRQTGFSALIDGINEVQSVSQDIEDLKQDVNEINALISNATQTENVLTLINRIAPEGNTEVVAFRDRIAQLASSNGLTIVSQRINDASITDNTQGENNILKLREIPTVFEITGTFEDIVQFCDDLSKIDDFIIVKQLELNRSQQEGSGNWTIRLSIAKYQFDDRDDNEVLKQLFLNVPYNAKINQRMQEYIENRNQ